MAKYWYVKAGGTAVVGSTIATTLRTGAWATDGTWAGDTTDYFATIALAMLGDSSGPPVGGDFVKVSDVYANSVATVITLTPAAASDTPVIVQSVDDTDVAVYKAGASETCTSTVNDISGPNVAGSKLAYSGVSISTSDNIDQKGGSSTWIIDDCTLTFTGSTDAFLVEGDGTYLQINNTTLIWTAGTTTSCFGPIHSNAQVDLNNCIFQNGSGAISELFNDGGRSSGATYRMNNCDFSEVAGYMWGDFGNDSTNDDNATMIMQNCRMNADPALFVQEDLLSHGQYFLATNCSSDLGKAEYQFYQKTISGVVQDSGDDGTSGGIYRAESTAFTNTNKTSFKITTTANCGEGVPLYFDMPARFADLTASGTDAVTVYIASAGALTTANCWVEVSYPDATNKQLWKTTSSRAADILSTTALTADGGSSDWENAGTDLTTENEYKITVTAVTGAASVPHIKFFCTVPSVTFYVDTTVDLS